MTVVSVLRVVIMVVRVEVTVVRMERVALSYLATIHTFPSRNTFPDTETMFLC